MDWKYGINGHERAVGTIVESKGRIHFARSFNFSDKVMIRDTEFMRPLGPYYIPVDGIASGMRVGDLVEFLTIEVHQGLMGLRVRKIGQVEEEPNWNEVGTACWESTDFPRLVGVVQSYFQEKTFGFIHSDETIANSFFHKCELLVPYEESASHEVINRWAKEGELKTFDSIETPNGMRALAIRNLSTEKR